MLLELYFEVVLNQYPNFTLNPHRHLAIQTLSLEIELSDLYGYYCCKSQLVLGEEVVWLMTW